MPLPTPFQCHGCYHCKLQADSVIVRDTQFPPVDLACVEGTEIEFQLQRLNGN